MGAASAGLLGFLHRGTGSNSLPSPSATRRHGIQEKMVRPRLLIFDFDGTALGGHEPYAQFPEPFVHFLDGLAGHGMQWVTNTTWSPEMQWEVIRRSGVRSTPAFLTGQTGRVLASVVEGKLVFDEEFAQLIAEKDRAFRERVWPRVRNLFITMLQHDLVNRLAFDFYAPQCVIDFTCNEGCEEEVWQLVRPLLDAGDYYVFNPAQRTSGMLLPAHMNKGDIVRVVQNRLDILPEETIVAGDASNDLHMFDPSLCGWMICPTNAEPIVKDHISRHGGIIATQPYSWGVIEGIESILRHCSKAAESEKRVKL